MTRNSSNSVLLTKDQSSQTLLESSVARYKRVFAKAPAMRFRCPWMVRKAIAWMAFSATLAVGASASYAQFQGKFDLTSLDGTNGIKVNGIDRFDRSGRSVSGAGDVNGDGFDDVIIGASNADANGNDDSGESYVVFGSNAGFSPSFNLSSLNGSNGFQINGVNGGDRSANSVSGAGDINGDGFDDLIIGAPSAVANGINDAGKSYVVFGSNAGFSPSINLSSLNGNNGFQINGVDGGDFSGSSVSGAGDVNGDGFDDLIIGASLAHANGNNDSGESYVVFGSNAGFSPSINLSSLNGTNGFRINGVDSFDYSGRSVSGAGDFNGDGIDDLIIGASGADPNGIGRAGESCIVFGQSNGFSAVINLDTLDGTNGFQLNGIDNLDQSGHSVSGAGDINGDGIDDLIIGAPGASPNASGVGESYVVFGQTDAISAIFDLGSLDGTNGFQINGTNTNEGSGRSVSGAGDINGDGFDDLIIGAGGFGGTGQSYVVFGSNAGFSPSIDLNMLNGTNGFQIPAIDFDQTNSNSVSGVGDFNGDGIDDLIIGAVTADPNGLRDAGESYIVFGRRAIPEPSSAMLLGAGLLGWCTCRRRR